MTLTKGGPVGIGTTEPSDMLHIRDVPAKHYGITTETDGEGRGLQVVTPDYAYREQGTTLQLGPFGESDDERSYLQAYTSGKKKNGVMLLNPHGGKIGIRSKHPTAELEVGGTVKAETILADELIVGKKALGEIVDRQEKEIGALRQKIEKLEAALEKSAVHV